MKRIMFNDRYGLTQAVIEGRKIMTRQVLAGYPMSSSDKIEEAYYAVDSIGVIANGGETLFEIKLCYRVGEVVAVAQSYNDVTREFPHLKTTLVGHDIMGSEPVCTNKLYVYPELMPHRIRITGIRCERLQDISDEDCMKEGIWKAENVGLQGTTYWYSGLVNSDFRTPREAFASLIDKVAGRGTWERNPWVVVYEFETIQ